MLLKTQTAKKHITPHQSKPKKKKQDNNLPLVLVNAFCSLHAITTTLASKQLLWQNNGTVITVTFIGTS